MATTSASKPRSGKPAASGLRKASAGRTKIVRRDDNTGQPAISKARFEAVILAAERSGLLSGKSGRIGGRVSPALVRQAKRQTGIVTDSDLIEFAWRALRSRMTSPPRSRSPEAKSIPR
jgi:hypothetical protein